MQLKKLYSEIIKTGIENDPRNKSEVAVYLQEQNKSFLESSDKEKNFFDKEKLTNPYSDTRILNGNGNEEFSSLLVGIDVETQDLLLADYIRKNSKKIDAVLTHHPEGKAFAELSDVMNIQEDVLSKFGLPINVAQDLLSTRITEVKRSIMPYNHERTISAAKHLEFPFLCAHTPADNCVYKYLKDLFEKENPNNLNDIIDLLLDIPEYASSARHGVAPLIIVGDKKRKTGKILVDMTGGTSGPEDIYSAYQNAGIGTIIGMHMGEKHRKEAEKNHINVIIAGHMASDSLGMNILLDSVLSDDVDIIEFSGFTRFKR